MTQVVSHLAKSQRETNFDKIWWKTKIPLICKFCIYQDFYRRHENVRKKFAAVRIRTSSTTIRIRIFYIRMILWKKLQADCVFQITKITQNYFICILLHMAESQRETSLFDKLRLSSQKNRETKMTFNLTKYENF